MMERLSLGKLAVWCHRPSEKPKANILLIHGITEHSARHLNTVNALVGYGYNVVRFDLRGAGESGGRRQWVNDFDEYVQDANTAYNWMKRSLESLPLFVLGHSLGGAIAIRFASARSHELAGLILSAPAFKVGGSISPVKIKLGRLLSYVASTIKIPAGEPVDVSRDKAVVKAFAEDPLSPRYNTVGQGTAILDTLPNTLEHIKKIHCPVFLVHGTHDRIIRIEGSFEILRQLNHPREMLVIPGGYHEPHNDNDKELYFQTLGRWLDRHLPQSHCAT